MGAAKYLELAVILKAVDNLSGTVRNALGGASNGYSQLANSQERADAAMRKGLTLGAGAKIALDILGDLTKKYGNVQEAQQDLRIAMLKPGGGIDEEMFVRYTALSERLSRAYAGSQMDYIDMIRAMKENKLEGNDILGGTGKAIAELSELFKTAPAEAAIFAARMKNDLKVRPDEMIKMVDLVARLKQVGVGHTGSETISGLTEFYGKIGMSASNLGMHGVADATQLGALAGLFFTKGIDPGTSATTMRRIFENISMPKKLEKMNEEAAKFGKHLVFFDSAGRWKGVGNFIAQLSTLKDLPVQKISQILGPGGSSNGMSGVALKYLAMHGEADYTGFLERLSDQADITTKVTEQQKGYNQQVRIMKTDLDNLEANLGKSYNPMMMKAAKITQSFANALSNFTAKHQIITGVVGGLGLIVGGAMALGSAIHFIGAMWTYSRIPLLLASIAGSNAWAAVTMGAESFAMVLLRLPSMISGVLASLAELGLAGGASIAALVAPFAILAHQMYTEHQKDVAANADYLKDNAAHPYQKNFVPMTQAEIDEFNAKKGSATKLKFNPISGLRNDVSFKSDHKDLTPALLSDMARNRTNANAKPTIHYAPTINVKGDTGPGTMEKVKQMLNDHSESLLDMIRHHKADSLRTSFQ